MFKFPARKTSAWGPLSGLLAAVGAYLLPQLIIFMTIDAVNRNGVFLATLDSVTLSLIQLGAAVGTFLLTALFLKKYGVSINKFINFQRHEVREQFFVAAKGLGVYLVFSILASIILSMILSSEVIDQPQDLGFSTDQTGLMLIPIALTLILVVPVVEELVFRGLIFNGFRTRMNFWLASMFSGGLFALAHLQINVGVDVFIMSIALAWVYEKSNSLVTPILLHAFKNSIAFVLLFMVG